MLLHYSNLYKRTVRIPSHLAQDFSMLVAVINMFLTRAVQMKDWLDSVALESDDTVTMRSDFALTSDITNYSAIFISKYDEL